MEFVVLPVLPVLPEAPKILLEEDGELEKELEPDVLVPNDEDDVVDPELPVDPVLPVWPNNPIVGTFASPR